MNEPCSTNSVSFVLQFNVLKPINIIAYAEMVPQACYRRLLVYRTVLTVCICSKQIIRSLIIESPPLFCSFNPLLIFFLLCPAAVFVQLCLPSIQNVSSNACRTHFTRTHYNGVFIFPEKHHSNKEPDPGLSADPDPGVTLQLFRPINHESVLTVVWKLYLLVMFGIFWLQIALNNYQNHFSRFLT